MKETATLEMIIPYFENARRIDVYSTNNSIVSSVKVNTDKEIEPAKIEGKRHIRYSYFIIAAFLISLAAFIYWRRKQY